MKYLILFIALFGFSFAQADTFDKERAITAILNSAPFLQVNDPDFGEVQTLEDFLKLYKKDKLEARDGDSVELYTDCELDDAALGTAYYSCRISIVYETRYEDVDAPDGWAIDESAAIAFINVKVIGGDVIVVSEETVEIVVAG